MNCCVQEVAVLTMFGFIIFMDMSLSNVVNSDDFFNLLFVMAFFNFVEWLLESLNQDFPSLFLCQTQTT